MFRSAWEGLVPRSAHLGDERWNKTPRILPSISLRCGSTLKTTNTDLNFIPKTESFFICVSHTLRELPTNELFD